jgi:predicted AAA+ superfamily ATPase
MHKMNDEILIPRSEHLARLAAFKDKRLIKIVTGIRRCGKSTLFELYQMHLLGNGAAPEQIISLNFEDPEHEGLLHYKKLYDHIKSRLIPDKMNYVFLDEIQNVPEYERAADGLFIQKNVDLYLTGSNAHMLSGEIATLLSGRYVEIQMLPLSFKEYVTAVQGEGNLQKAYADYVRYSSFPYALALGDDRRRINEYLGGLYNTIIFKDVVSRKKIADPLMLDSVVRFMFFNIGNLLSTTNIANTMKSQGRPVSIHTVENYLSALTDAYVFYRAGRYDIKGRQYLTTGDKYYIADIGLRYYLLGTKNVNMGSILENIVYLELLSRGYRVFVGKLGNTEVDFVAEKPGGQTEYFQAALTVRDQATLERELAPLNNIKDHNAKYLLTLDMDPEAAYNGIRQLNALDWLMTDTSKN